MREIQNGERRVKQMYSDSDRKSGKRKSKNVVRQGEVIVRVGEVRIREWER